MHSEIIDIIQFVKSITNVVKKVRRNESKEQKYFTIYFKTNYL